MNVEIGTDARAIPFLVTHKWDFRCSAIPCTVSFRHVDVVQGIAESSFFGLADDLHFVLPN
jgi:hypothetical protein